MKLDLVSAFSLVQDYNTLNKERLLSTFVAKVARVALSLKRTLVGGRRFSAQFWTAGIHVFFLSTATIGTCRRAESVVGCEQVSFVLVQKYQRARSHALLLWTTTSLHSKEVEPRS